MSPLPAPTRQEAEHFAREFGYLEALLGAQVSATAGTTPIHITSVPMAEAFLQPIDDIASGDIHATINYIHPPKLAAWVRGSVGDMDLADALDPIASDGRAFGYLVRDIKPVLAARVEQYAEALGLCRTEHGTGRERS